MTDKEMICKRNDKDCEQCSFEEQLKAIEQECKALRDEKAYTDMACEHFEKQLKAKEQECEKLKQGYAELTKIVSPYMDDFTGYNEELEGFDVVLCVKQLLEQLNQFKIECKRLKLDLIEAKAHRDYLNNLDLSETLNLVSERLGQLKAENDELKNREKCAWKSLEGTFCPEAQEQLNQLKTENDELKKANLHIENNREHKANKLNRIEKLILACSTGYIDEFTQELLVILHEPEPSSFENKYKATLAEIREFVKKKMKKMSEEGCGELTECYFKDKQCEKCSEDKCLVYWFDKILQKISEVK